MFTSIIKIHFIIIEYSKKTVIFFVFLSLILVITNLIFLIWYNNEATKLNDQVLFLMPTIYHLCATVQL